MDTITKEHELAQSQNIVADNLEKLKQLFPTAFTEGKVDFDALRSVLGDYVENENERYQFTWKGKAQALREAHKTSTGTLRPCPEESVNWATTQNLYIEGDNLEVLKLLQKSYHGRVKMIYIDPPYNTGKDFVYKDSYKDNLKNYLELTEQGKEFGTNSESSGRYHSNWLNMMYPRLKLARNLLREDGVIFISIDDNEVENLKSICDEIYGEENFISTIANINNPKGRSDDKYIATAHEYILVYKKADLVFYGWEPEENVIKRYNKEEGGIKYREIDLRKTGDNDRREDRPNLFYFFYFNPDTLDFYPSRDASTPNGYIQIIPTREDESHGNWRWELKSAESKLHKLIPKYMNIRKKWSVFEKDFLTQDKRVKPTSAWTHKFANSERGTEQFIDLGFNKQIFPRPKPVGLIKALAKTVTNSDEIILDFFSGSASTAHAVLDLNFEDGANRKFILVQLPETVDVSHEAYKDGFTTIAEIGKERVRRVLQKIKEEDSDRAKQLDLGFKVLKLDSSNIKEWDPSSEDIQKTLYDSINNIKSDRTEADILYEILLKYGLDLTLPIQEYEIAGNNVFSIGHGALLVCLSTNITKETIGGIGELKEDLAPEVCRVVLRDNGFKDDVAKTNAMQVLKRYGIEDVKSI